MCKGIWDVEYVTFSMRGGGGRLELSNNIVSGGDHGYAYYGKYQFDGTDLKGDVEVSLHEKDRVETIFDDISGFNLEKFNVKFESLTINSRYIILKANMVELDQDFILFLIK